MPISKLFGGHGSKVMANMKEEYYGEKKGKQVFYATENKHKGIGGLDHKKKAKKSKKSSMFSKGY